MTVASRNSSAFLRKIYRCGVSEYGARDAEGEANSETDLLQALESLVLRLHVLLELEHLGTHALVTFAWYEVLFARALPHAADAK